MRPLAPFTLRPIRNSSVRRTVTADAIRIAAEQEPAGLKKPERIALKTVKPIRGLGLRVLARADNDAE